MAWKEKRKGGRYRMRETIDGQRFDIVPDLGRWETPAEACVVEYKKAKVLGFRWDPSIPDTMVAVREYLKAKAEGRDVQPTKAIEDAAKSWMIDVKRDPETLALLDQTIRFFLTYSKIRLLTEITKDVIDQWRSAMESGELTWTRGGKDQDGQEIRYEYKPATINLHMRNLRSFIQYCVDREWLPVKLVRLIKTKKAPSTRRFLVREEIVRLIKACRVERFAQPGSGGGRTPIEIEQRVVRHSIANPTFGKLRLSKSLSTGGLSVYPSTVRQIWGRYGIETPQARLLWAKKKQIPGTIDRQVAIVENRNANNRLRKIILFGLYTGMRSGEVLRARWNNVTAQETLRRLPSGRILSQIIYSLFIPKAKKFKQRTVALHCRIAQIMGAAKHMGSSGLLFPGWTEGNLGQARRAAVARAGLTKARFHDLRHSFVRNYLKSKTGSMGEVREQTGHENLASLDPYAHFANEDIAATISNMKIS